MLVQPISSISKNVITNLPKYTLNKIVLTVHRKTINPVNNLPLDLTSRENMNNRQEDTSIRGVTIIFFQECTSQWLIYATTAHPSFPIEHDLSVFDQTLGAAPKCQKYCNDTVHIWINLFNPYSFGSEQWYTEWMIYISFIYAAVNAQWNSPESEYSSMLYVFYHGPLGNKEF